jgi:hypothetical protein
MTYAWLSIEFQMAQLPLRSPAEPQKLWLFRGTSNFRPALTLRGVGSALKGRSGHALSTDTGTSNVLCVTEKPGNTSRSDRNASTAPLHAELRDGDSMSIDERTR